MDALEVRLYNALIFGQSEEVIEIFRLVSKKWLAELERIEEKKREAEAQFKFKQVDMGETVESQEELEEQEFLDFFATKNEFQSEAEGIPEAVGGSGGAKESPDSKDSLAKYQKFVEIFIHPKLISNDSKNKADLSLASEKINSIFMQRLLRAKLKTEGGARLSDNDRSLVQLVMANFSTSSDLLKWVDRESDVYRRANPPEAISVVPLLRILKSRVLELLQQFPEHPTLTSVVQSIDRVFLLSPFVPVITLCTGIELVLSRVNDWHVNAPKALGMRQETDQLWAQVVEWRKRELNQWKDILQNTIKQEGRKAREIFPQLFLSLDSNDLEVVRLAAINFIIEAKLGCPNLSLTPLSFPTHCRSRFLGPKEYSGHPNKSVLILNLDLIY